METVALDLARVPESIGRSRAAMRPLRDALGERYDDAVLLVSELVTNAVRHGQGDTVQLAVRVRAGACRVEIVDGGSGFQPPAGSPDPAEPGGRGLRIVDSLSDAWGVYEGNSTHVWFEIDLDR